MIARMTSLALAGLVLALAGCATVGGKIEAKQDGGDPTQLANYSCVIPQGGK